jgi:hypothetical protein
MKPIIYFELDKVYSVESSFFADKELTDLYFEKKEISESNIYFITIAKKILFDTKNLIINDNGDLKTNLIIGKTDLLLPIEIKELKLKSINKDETNSKQITALNVENQIVKFTPNAIVTNLDLNLKNDPEIIYIGQSYRMQERIKNHEKIIQAFSGLKDDEDLTMHFVNLNFGFTNVQTNEFLLFNKLTLNSLNFFGFNYNKLVDLSERILINFFLPKLNINHIKTDIEKDKILNEIIYEYDIQKVICNYDLIGNSYQFKSSNQKLQVKIFNIDCSNKPFIFNMEKLGNR